MPLYEILQFDPRTKQETVLGRVRAKNQPRAILNALKKYRITDVRLQRRTGARPVKAIKQAAQNALLDISPEERAVLRSLTDTLSNALHHVGKGE